MNVPSNDIISTHQAVVFESYKLVCLEFEQHIHYVDSEWVNYQSINQSLLCQEAAQMQ